MARLAAPDGSEKQWFGRSISLSGELLVAGADDDVLGDLAGHAYLFERRGPGAWEEIKKLTASDAEIGDHFGSSVAIAKDVLVVGASAAGTGGAVYVFGRDVGGRDQWGELAKLTAPDAMRLDRFGDSVAISGGIIVAGAPDTPEPHEPGAAYVYALADCILRLALEARQLEPGDELQGRILLRHNRPRSVTVRLVLRVETLDGRIVASRALPPQRIGFGDGISRSFSLRLPLELEPGPYRLVAGVERMQQGMATAVQRFNVTRSTPALPPD